MSWSVSSPMFPSLTPRATDPLWFTVDKPVDEEAEIARMEAEHTQVTDMWHLAKGLYRGAKLGMEMLVGTFPRALWLSLSLQILHASIQYYKAALKINAEKYL